MAKPTGTKDQLMQQGLLFAILERLGAWSPTAEGCITLPCECSPPLTRMVTLPQTPPWRAVLAAFTPSQGPGREDAHLFFESDGVVIG